MKWELPDVKDGFKKHRGTRGQIAHIHWIIEKVGQFQKKKIYFADYSKAFDFVHHKKLWKTPDHLTTLLASWEICMQVKK